jgi:hypothetical protein
LKIAPIPVSKTYIDKFQANETAEMKKQAETATDPSKKYAYNQLKRALKSYDFSLLFDMYLPLYKEILVDSDGNFLVFKFTDCLKSCTPLFQVYSSKGKFVCETRLNKGKFELEIDRRFKKIHFTSEGIFGLFVNQGDEDEILRLIKSNYPLAP